YRFLGADLGELANKVIDLNAITGSFADRLEERLAETKSWPARFDLVESVLKERMTRTADHPLAHRAFDMIASRRGDIRIGALARHLDCSRKHLVSVFHRYVGLPPKAVARVLRFECAMEQIGAGRHATLAELALSCGYADQAHFNRDFVAFAGETPR